MKKSNKYWCNRREILFQRQLRDATNDIAQQYLRLYNQTTGDLLQLLEEIEKGIVHEGGINERPVLPSDLYKAQSYYKLLNDFNTNASNLGIKEGQEISNQLKDMYHKQVELTTIELAKNKEFILSNPELVQKAINAVWCSDGKNWSDRVWTNKAIMEQELRDGIVNIIAKGYSSQKLSQELAQFVKEDVNKGFNRAYRLVHTELSFVQTQATLDKYKEAGIQYYEILAANGACSDCAENYNGQIYRLDEAQVGVNCPPFHPNCRCTTLAVLNPKGGTK